MPKLETRAINTDLTASDDETRTVSGTAVVFNRDSEDLGGFIEQVDPHAFDGVDLRDVFMLFNHDYNSVLCRTIANTLELTLDDAGLHFKASLPDTSIGHDTYENVRNGNIQGCSFGFTVNEDKWDTSSTVYRREILKIGELYEITLTPIPAYKDTDVSVAQRFIKQKTSDLDKLKAELELMTI